MSTISLRPDSPGVDQDARGDHGTLRVEFPHWAAQVVVYDDRARAVAALSALDSDRVGQEISSEIALPPGIYEVRAALAGATERELVPVRANSTTTVARDRWETLGLRTAAPLAGTATANASHIAAAEKWSRKTTWRAAPAGKSQFFLFVRTLDPRRHPLFAAGLQLLDASGRLVTDFTDGTKNDAEEGWLAFNADLPAGYYILRRGRSGIPLRYQPLYLADGWATQMFLQARGYPSLHTAALNMTPQDAGFRADDGAFLAAEILVKIQDRPECHTVATSAQVKALLGAETPNPWLAIVTANALRASQLRQTSSAKRKDPRRTTLPRYVEDVLEGLHDHPDVRAVRLRENRPAAHPLAYPPMLRRSLIFARAHATAHAATIPFDSLTDRALDNLLTKSPWTAWESLDPQRGPDPAPVPASIGQGESRLRTRSLPRPDPADLVVAFSMALIDVASPAAPIFYLARQPSARHWQVASIMLATLLEAMAIPGTPQDDPVVQTALMMVRPWRVADLPERVIVNPASVNVERGLQRLLQNVVPREVSVASGQPLARIEQRLQRLLYGVDDGDGSDVRTRLAMLPVTAADQAILTFAVKEVVAAVRQTFDAPVATKMPAKPGPALVSIEEIAARLRAEADRVLSGGDTAAQPELASRVRGVADRLRQVAESLLAGARYTVVTDGQGGIVFGNGAFRDLLSPPELARAGGNAMERRQQPKAKWRAWEDALRAVSAGTSVLVSPAPAEWKLRRAAMSDAASGEVEAFLNVLNNPEAPRTSATVLRAMEPLLSQLSLLAPLFAYGSAAERERNLDELEALVEDFAKVVKTS